MRGSIAPPAASGIGGFIPVKLVFLKSLGSSRLGKSKNYSVFRDTAIIQHFMDNQSFAFQYKNSKFFVLDIGRSCFMFLNVFVGMQKRTKANENVYRVFPPLACFSSAAAVITIS